MKGNQFDTKNHSALDYPDAKSMTSSTLTYSKFDGEFGLADNKIFKSTGVKYSNLKLEYMLGSEKVVSFGVLNNAGTMMCLKLEGKIQDELKVSF